MKFSQTSLFGKEEDPEPECKKLFEEFRKNYPGAKRGLDTEFNVFKKHNKNWKKVLTTLNKNVMRQIKEKNKMRELGRWVSEWKNLQTYLRNSGWEEEFYALDHKSAEEYRVKEWVAKKTLEKLIDKDDVRELRENLKFLNKRKVVPDD